MKSQQQINPERPKLILRVGVTGHRPDKLDYIDTVNLNEKLTKIFDQLKSIVQRARDQAKDAFAEHSPLLYIVSPLADGADQIVADKAIAEGFELQCPVPFFLPENKNDAEKLYGKNLHNAIVFELDGLTENKDQAYEAAGRMVLRHSDVLIAIWDKNHPRGVGGTGQIVSEARKLGIPTIWINSVKPHDASLLVRNKDGKWESKDLSWLDDLLSLKLAPPAEVKEEHSKNHHDHKDLRKEYLQETMLPLGGSFLKKFFHELIHLRILLPRGKSTEPEWSSEISKWTDLSQETRTVLKGVVDRIEVKLRTHYEHADDLANRYSKLYYKGFISNYLMSGLAVMFAFLLFSLETIHFEHAEIFGIFEFVALGLIMLVYLFDKKGRWYDRRIDYRLLAEVIRQTRFLATIGRIPPLSAPHAIHTHYGDPSGSWVYWHYLSVVKQLGIPHTKLTSEYLRAVARLIKLETDEQAEYHDRKSTQNSKLNGLFHIFAVLMFIIAFLACLSHVFFELPHKIKPFLSFLAIVSPAFGAALAGIRSQGEYERIARHSAAMADYLKEKSEELDKLQHNTHLTSASLAKVVDDIAEKRIEEVLDWRIVFHKRPIELA